MASTVRQMCVQSRLRLSACAHACGRLPSAVLGAFSYDSFLCEYFQAHEMTVVQHSPEADSQTNGKEPQCNN